MLKNIQLRIDNPCSEHWDRMSPDDQGRFCASCEKMVVDFASMDDQEVLHWFTRRQEPVCGRFRPDQLNRSFTASPEKKGSRWQYWHYLVAGLLFTSKAPAQTNPAKPQVSQHILPQRESHLLGDTTIAPAPGPLRGRVMDGSGNPVPAASVMFSSTQGVSADVDGYFSIDGNKVPAGQMLTISAVGYNSIQVDVNKLRADGQKQVFPVVLMDQAALGFVTVAVRHPKKRRSKADTVSLFKDSLSCVGLASKALTVYPNPVARGSALTLSMRLDQPGTYSVELFSTSGAPLETLQVDGRQKSRSIPMNIPASLAPGTYFIRLSHPALKKYYTQQIVVF